MKNKIETLQKIEHLTETEKLALFNVEELESRLEMAAEPIAQLAASDGNSVCWIG